ncbi:unnamed protein product [Rangifer tarandus platyrhynchus]|uniref:Uncharacterized protein n=1 Tax=Rangifer tarandus platyrhynchus TaxID=3082113 RepID=A0AC60A6U4_RANTA
MQSPQPEKAAGQELPSPPSSNSRFHPKRQFLEENMDLHSSPLLLSKFQLCDVFFLICEHLSSLSLPLPDSVWKRCPHCLPPPSEGRGAPGYETVVCEQAGEKAAVTGTQSVSPRFHL